jgi:CsoR family transcriptional regulator, copper-sensing transcriptional repressor
MGSPTVFIPCGGTVEDMPGYDMSKDDLLKRLRRIEGQVRGIAQMVDDDRYCIDVLTQISAATRALQSVAVGMFDDHLRHCVADAVADGGPDAERKLTEATSAVERLLRA